MSEERAPHGRTRSSGRAALAVLALVLCLSAVKVASAAFVDRETSALTLRAATLEPPTSVAAALGACSSGVSDAVVLSWTPSITTAVAGYEILRATASAGPYALVAMVTGRTVDTYTDTPPAFETTYHYVLRSTKESWLSVETVPVLATTRSSQCL